MLVKCKYNNHLDSHNSVNGRLRESLKNIYRVESLVLDSLNCGLIQTNARSQTPAYKNHRYSIKWTGSPVPPLPELDNADGCVTLP